MKTLPTFRQLRFLVAVVDRCHFGRAAEDCFVSQSTLSAGVQELEDLLGVRLLERSRRSVAPTPIGLQIATQARQLIKSGEDLVDIAAAAQDPMSGPLQLGLIPTIGPFIVPRAMPLLRRRLPKLKTYLREEQTAPLLARLAAGQVDAAVIALPFPLEGLEVADLGEDPFFLVAPPDHPLARLKSVRPDDIAGEDLLLLEDGHCMRDHALAACALEGARRNIAFQGTSLHTLVQMVAEGLGLTILPKIALEAGILRGLKLTALPLRGDMPGRRLALVWRATSGRKETFLRVAEALRECLHDLHAPSSGKALPAEAAS